MTNPDFRITDAIHSKGGKFQSYKEVKSDGSDLTTPDTWHDLPYRSKTTTDLKRARKVINGEDGEVITTELDAIDPSVTFTSLEDTVALRIFITKTSVDKYYAVMRDEGEDTTGKRAEVIYPLVQFDNSYKVDAPGRTPEIKFIPYRVDKDITQATLPTWAKSDETDLKVSAGDYYAINAASLIP